MPRHHPAGDRHGYQRSDRDSEQRQSQDTGTEGQFLLDGRNVRNPTGEGGAVDQKDGGDRDPGMSRFHRFGVAHSVHDGSHPARVRGVAGKARFSGICGTLIYEIFSRPF